MQGFPNGGNWWGGQFGQNGQKLHENYKIGILGSKQWGRAWGNKPIFRVVGGSHPIPPTRGNPGMYVKYHHISIHVENL